MGWKWTRIWSRFINRFNLIGKWMHLYRIKKAKQILKKLKEIERSEGGDGRILLYLRKINPYVFEELVLTSIENSNVRIYRNKRYSGDGGIDGIFKTSRGKVLIQCKRYKKYIDHKDVTELSQKVKSDKYIGGIFVHTGKTGAKSKEIVKVESNIVIISGSTLIGLVLERITIEMILSKKMNAQKSNRQ